MGRVVNCNLDRDQLQCFWISKTLKNPNAHPNNNVWPTSHPTQTINLLGKKAREGTISIDEMAGGTFTISNGGVYGSMLSTPIINPPQVRFGGLGCVCVSNLFKHQTLQHKQSKEEGG